jgi:DNA-binding beta-propeller fold protein YncE
VINNAGICTTGTCVQPVTVIPLAPGSGATGVEIFDDSIAWVANPTLNTVTRVNYLLGDTVSFPVGPSPRAVVIADSSLFVVNANMAGSQPAGPSSITFRPAQVGMFPSSAFGTIALSLSCLSARSATLGDDGLIYVTCGGHPGAGDGRLSIVDPVARTELAVINGLGESPGSAAFHPSGRLLIASDTSGILEVNTLTRSITRGPGQGVKLDGAGVAALAVDERGRVYALVPGNCMAPGVLYVLAAPPSYNELRQVPVGVCPSAAATVRVF